jgi:amino acid transporter
LAATARIRRRGSPPSGDHTAELAAPGELLAVRAALLDDLCYLAAGHAGHLECSAHDVTGLDRSVHHCSDGIDRTRGGKAIAQNPVSVFALAFEHALGGFSSLGVLILIASMFLGMVSTTADGARALYGLAREGIVLLLGQPLSILLASNLGYIVAISLAVAAFLLFGKDRPNLERPIKRSPIWIPIAWALLVFDLFVLTIGVTHPGLAGYGGAKQTLVGLGILLLAVLLFIYRQVIQERAPLRWRVRDENADIQGPQPEQELV